ncbi:(2Fe-2S)-binding protein [Beijerinckia sp. L45]|uniref:(2Fe-2S)-binding protein n=1 Tax=Beijerinckia sp. L45 TaxID=1641855 RepID=UPI00131BDBAA|nr:(2Fe-2S)-binding protein [Beijerinckia sp. L45]
MSRTADLVIVGAGPAGMAAAVTARRHQLDVLVVDEQAAPGGQIWRDVEAVSCKPQAAFLGNAYHEGLAAVGRFRASGATYEPNTKVWQVEAGPRAFLTRDGAASSVKARSMLLATGAQERPVPFPGWTLPGVMTVGAAQIMLKTSGQVPVEPVWIAANGPLALLYAAQLLKMGGRIAGFLDTTPAIDVSATIPKLAAAAFAAPGDLLKGLGWIVNLRRHVPYIRHVARIEAFGTDRLERFRYETASGVAATVDAHLLLVHEGVVPSIHPTLSLGCVHNWLGGQDCFAPALDAWGETSEAGIFVAGDGGGIGGAAVASLRGEIAGLRIAARAGRISAVEAQAAAQPIRSRLKRALTARSFLDAFYRPRASIFVPADETIACRCEEVSVASIRAQAAIGRPGPNQIKASTRAGMGPCQGRQCSYTIASVLADAEGRQVPDIGLYRVRPPLKPLTLDELASLDDVGCPT